MILLVAILAVLVYLGPRPGDETGVPTPAGVATSSVPESVAHAPVVDLGSPADEVPSAASLESVAGVRWTLIVLPNRIANPDAATEAFMDAVRQAMLRALRGRPNVEVVDVSPADLAVISPPDAGPLGQDRILYLAVVRRYGSQHVVELSEQSQAESDSWTLVGLVRAQYGGGTTTITVRKGYDPTPGNDPENLGARFAQGSIQGAIGPVLSSESQDALQTVILDRTRLDDERLAALAEIGIGSIDSETVAAAVDLATRSASADTRRRVWETLGQRAYDPALVQPLGFALLSDSDAAVRSEAALALAAYLGDDFARSTLESALANDSSADVRLAARMAMMSRDELMVFKRATLLDRSLSPAERLAPTSIVSRRPDSNAMGGRDPADPEILRSYAEIVAGAADPDVKRGSLEELYRTMLLRSLTLEPAVIDVLIASADSNDVGVRRAALNVLKSQVGYPEVRAVLEGVRREQPDLAADLRLEAILGAP